MLSAQTQEANCDAWIDVFTRLNSDGLPTLDHLERITSPEVRFRDPFNDMVGRSAVLELLEHTRRQIRDVRFQIIDRASSGQRVYLKWEMTGRLRLLGVWRVEGMSELVFDAEGKLKQHRDYWDASEQFYGRLPVIGWVLARIRSLASVS